MSMIRCPVCGSISIYPVAGGYIGQVYRCKDCGYRGSFICDDRQEDGGCDGRNDRDGPGASSRKGRRGGGER